MCLQWHLQTIHLKFGVISRVWWKVKANNFSSFRMSNQFLLLKIFRYIYFFLQKFWCLLSHLESSYMSKSIFPTFDLMVFIYFFFFHLAKLSNGIWLFAEIWYWNGKPSNWRPIKRINQNITKICQYSSNWTNWWKHNFINEKTTVWSTRQSKFKWFFSNKSIKKTQSTICHSRTKMVKYQYHMEVSSCLWK